MEHILLVRVTLSNWREALCLIFPLWGGGFRPDTLMSSEPISKGVLPFLLIFVNMKDKRKENL